MKNKNIRHLFLSAIAALAALAVPTACNDGYEQLPADQFTNDYLFSTTDSLGEQATHFLASLYATIPNGYNSVGGDMLDAASDDAVSVDMDNNPDVLKLATGRYTANNRVTSDMMWGSCYNSIRIANILINGIDRVPFKNTYVNALGETRPLGVSMKAEARFIRAYFYFLLLERYGGIPIVGDRVYSLQDDIQLPRRSFADCVEYITSELDDIKDSLRVVTPLGLGQYAHAATKQACMALKARVLLYAASPLFNGQTLENGNELVGYVDYDHSRWEKAAKAAKEFIDEFGQNGNLSADLPADARNVFLNYYGAANRELIFFKANDDGTTTERNNGPLGFTGNNLGYGRTNPTQNLVDAFLMKDGKPRGQSTKYTYNDQNPYANRDPRLDYNILYNGAKWLGTNLETFVGGKNNPGKGNNSTHTSYYMCKFMGNFSNSTDYSEHHRLWVILRYAEVLLNFCEAENEVLDEPSQEIYDILIALHKRGGIESGGRNGTYGVTTMTKEQMREYIRNERRIELAFEGHRYFDIRRWRIAEQVFSQPLQGMQIIKGTSSLSYNRVDVLKVDFDSKRYLYPIPYSEVNKNPNILQNPNW